METKVWWKSKTVWTAAAALLAAILYSKELINYEEVRVIELYLVPLMVLFLRLGSKILTLRDEKDELGNITTGHNNVTIGPRD